MTTFFSRRDFMLSGLALTATGCSNSPISRTVAAYWDQTSGKDRFTRAQVEQLPYACIAVGIDDQPRAMVVLGYVNGHELQWISADKGALITRHGRVVRSLNLAAGNLGGTIALEPDPLDPTEWPRSKTQARRWRRQVDFMPSRRMGVVITADWQPEGETTLSTYWGERSVVAATENCVVSDSGKRFKNRFWLDATNGSVVQSEQFVDATLPSLRIEVLKPYRAAG